MANNYLNLLFGIKLKNIQDIHKILYSMLVHRRYKFEVRIVKKIIKVLISTSVFLAYDALALLPASAFSDINDRPRHPVPPSQVQPYSYGDAKSKNNDLQKETRSRNFSNRTETKKTSDEKVKIQEENTKNNISNNSDVHPNRSIDDIDIKSEKNSVAASLSTNSTVYEQAQSTNRPMTYNQALLYQQRYPKEIYVSNYKDKDEFGNKSYYRRFDLLGDDGVGHSGNTIVGVGDRTWLRFTIKYGFESEKNVIPSAYFDWSADLVGDPDKGFKPKYFRVVFLDGYVKELPLQEWIYSPKIISGLLVTSTAHNFYGSIKLEDVDVYELLSHGDVGAVYMDNGAGGMRHFFYSGDKDTKNKYKLTRGIYHAAKILNINDDTMNAKFNIQKENSEKARKNKIRAEIIKELDDAEEREAILQEILAERDVANSTKEELASKN